MERQVIIRPKESFDNYFDSRPEGSVRAVVSNQSEVVPSRDIWKKI
jgi:pyridoxine/pyridoxamine 5'-phosphate oxidase